MTAREQDVADNIIREMGDRRAHWYRVRVTFGVLGLGAMSLWLLIEGVVWASHRLGGVQ